MGFSVGGSIAHRVNESMKRRNRPTKNAFETWRQGELIYREKGHRKKTLDQEAILQIRYQIIKDKKKRILKSILLLPVSMLATGLLFYLIKFIAQYGH